MIINNKIYSVYIVYLPLFLLYALMAAVVCFGIFYGVN